MKKILFVFISLLFALGAQCQNIGSMSYLLKELEVSDLSSRAKVVVVNHIALDLVEQIGMVDGYKIRLVFDNSQNARDSVENERLRYLELYPSDSTYVDYQAPYFKLTAGNFLNYEEALMRWSRVVRYFRSAFIVKEKISISQFMSYDLRDELGLIPESTDLESELNEEQLPVELD